METDLYPYITEYDDSFSDSEGGLVEEHGPPAIDEEERVQPPASAAQALVDLSAFSKQGERGGGKDAAAESERGGDRLRERHKTKRRSGALGTARRRRRRRARKRRRKNTRIQRMHRPPREHAAGLELAERKKCQVGNKAKRRSQPIGSQHRKNKKPTLPSASS